MDYLASFHGIISGGNMQINNVSARNYIHRTILSQYHTMTCSPWQHRKCSRCRWWPWSGDGHIQFCFPQSLGVVNPEGHYLWTQPQSRCAWCRSLMEYHGPVWIIVTDRRIDIEAIGKFRVDSNLITRFQLISEVHLNAFWVNYHKVVERLVRLQGVHTLATFQSRCFCLIM